MDAAFGGGGLDGEAIVEEGELESDGGALLIRGVACADAAGVHAVFEEDFGEVGQTAAGAGVDPEGVIFDVAGCGLVMEGGGGAEEFAAEHDGGVGEGVAEEECAFDGAGIGGVADDAEALAGGIDLFEPAADDADGGVFVEEGGLAGESAGEHDIVGVHAGEVLATGEGDEAVEGWDDAGIGLADEADAGV